MRQFGYAIVAVLLLLAIYVGAYYATVEREMTPIHVFGRGWSMEFFVAYRFAPEVSEALFRPMHKIDRAIRSEYWTP